MTLRVLIAVCFTACLAARDEPCLSPVGDYILAKDLARVRPELVAVSSSRVLAPAPVIGGKRIFRSEEIRWLAAQYGVKVDSNTDVCFAWPMTPLSRNDVLDALRKSIDNSDARIEITDITTDRAPHGQLDFPLAGLGTPASPEQPVPVLWRGEVVYADTRRFAVWARVRITAPVTVVVAAERLPAGHAIGASQLRTEIRQRFPAIKSEVTAINQVVGMLPLRSLLPGAELRMESLSWPNDVNRGDLVTIEARNGGVKLAFSGRAESAGRTGDLITVRNPETQKIFQARVCAHDKAIVEALVEPNSPQRR